MLFEIEKVVLIHFSCEKKKAIILKKIVFYLVLFFLQMAK